MNLLLTPKIKQKEKYKCYTNYRLNSKIIDIQHVRSTAISNIQTKPIIVFKLNKKIQHAPKPEDFKYASETLI